MIDLLKRYKITAVTVAIWCSSMGIAWVVQNGAR